MPLSDIQDALCRLYDLRVSCDVGDFVCDADAVHRAAGATAHARGEVLVVVEDDDGLTVGLYVDPEALSHLESEDGDAWLDDGRRWAACLATEGVSHFVYLVFRADNDTQVSELELELQAEIDKYASAVLEPSGVESSRDGDLLGEQGLVGNGILQIRARSRAVRERLFAGVRFLDGPESARGERYRVAHRIAARYAASLERRHLEQGDIPAFLRELRRFYRHGLREKLEAAR
jgi:hypothetical protein